MNRFQQVVTVVALSLVVLAPLTAAAAPGTVTGLTLAPSPAAVGSPVTITIAGTGTCDSLDLDFGDGTPHAILSGTFPHSATHSYKAAGTLSLTAKGVSKCAGKASASLTVTGGVSLIDLCTKVGAERPIDIFTAVCVGPKITGFFPFSLMKPGGVVGISGCGFGSSPGEFRLVGDFPGGYLKLETFKWTDEIVSGTIPKGITGVKDQPATLQIVRADKKVSNTWPVTFTAAREIRLFPAAEVKEFFCAEGADSDECQGSWMSPQPTFHGYHHSVGILAIWESGTDWFKIPELKNQWVIDSVDERCHYKINATLLGPFGFKEGATSATVQETWALTHGYLSYSHAHYCPDVYITGPIGTSYK